MCAETSNIIPSQLQNFPDRLEKAYELLVKRIINEYEQRDRDFRMYVTINTGLLGLSGFLFNGFRKTSTEEGWLFFGYLLALTSVFGIAFALGLRESVRNFAYWQTLMNVDLARYEYTLLPDYRFGHWLHVLARNTYSQKHLTAQDEDVKSAVNKLAEEISLPLKRDLLSIRPKLSYLFLTAWGALLALAVSLICSEVMRVDVTDIFAN